MRKVLIVLGTRPEIIKLGPVHRELSRLKNVHVDTFWSGQHVELADGLIDLFGINVTHTGNNLLARRGLPEKLGQMLEELSQITEKTAYDWIIVQGDTTTATAGAIIGFLKQIPVAHVEAGLRTWDIDSPWPEEFNRRVISVCSRAHFAPTEEARENLLEDRVDPDAIVVTGNTVVDALQHIRSQVRFNYTPISSQVANIPNDKKLVLVTGHRRENAGKPLKNIIQSLRTLAKDGDKTIVFPVHLNPDVRRVVHARLGGLDNIHLLDPLQYPDFVYLMEKAWTVVTDSGGIQEEAPSFHRPIVVTRVSTERPEVVEAGFARLVGSNSSLIVDTVRQFTSGSAPMYIEGDNPFGKGDAAERIVASLIHWRKPKKPQTAREHAARRSFGAFQAQLVTP